MPRKNGGNPSGLFKPNRDKPRDNYAPGEWTQPAPTNVSGDFCGIEASKPQVPAWASSRKKTKG